jgi:hypothetical protein
MPRQRALGIVIFLLGLLVGYFAFGNKSDSLDFSDVREDSADYAFINPLLFVKVPEQISFPQYRPLKNAIDEYTRKATANSRATDISVYFRNLDSSQWVGINSATVFSPASMLKVVTMIATLRSAESDPLLLKSTAVITGKNGELPLDIQSYYPPIDPVVAEKNTLLMSLSNTSLSIRTMSPITRCMK